MKESCLNNIVRLAVATNCLKSKSLPPIKFPREVISYKNHSLSNRKFDFDMNEPIVYSRMKIEQKANVLTIGTGADAYDFVISYLSSHEKGLLSTLVKDNGFIEESVFNALNEQQYFKQLVLENDLDLFLEKAYKALDQFLFNPKRKKIYIFNNFEDKEFYLKIFNYIDQKATSFVEIYVDEKIDFNPRGGCIKIYEFDFVHSHAEIASDAISSVQCGKTVQMCGDAIILPELKRLLLQRKVDVPELGSEIDPKKTTVIACYNAFELLNSYLNIVRENKETLVYVINGNFGESELMTMFLPLEYRTQFFSLDSKVLWKAYFTTYKI